jgi:thiamine pyrophosphate-dependent acetolactate synthase large subunit-like protein
MNARDDKAPQIQHDTPVSYEPNGQVWGSDAIALMLREMDIPYLALNPGASYRGLHDSLVNHLGNERPQMLLCLHEESAVAIAHGYAKASGRMMGAILHSNVGLMHGSMAIFNAWCDRVPMLVLGATGPIDAHRRRPWIDWIHTVSDQGALVRDFTKWDNTPGSVSAAYEALLRASQIARTAPRGPTYVNLDVSLQEGKLDKLPTMPDPRRFEPGTPVEPAKEAVVRAAIMLSRARAPVILMGRASRSLDAWNARVALAEKLQARVITDLKTAAVFPTDHPLHAAPPGAFMGPEAIAILREADVVLALDTIDTAGMLKQAFGNDPITAQIINVSVDQYSHRGFGAEHQALVPADVLLLCEPEQAVTALLPAVSARQAANVVPRRELGAPSTEAVSIHGVATALNHATRGLDVSIVRVPLGWNGAYRDWKHPMDFLGSDGGGGIGSGPGNIVGSALALKDMGRLAIGLIGDGDFLMGVTALWTAAHYKVPGLVIVCNNRSFFNDELHQERVAKERTRPVENRWIGQRISEPDIDLAAMARAQGCHGIGPITDPRGVQAAIEQGLEVAKRGGFCVIDMRVLPGYDSNMSGSNVAHKR